MSRHTTIIALGEYFAKKGLKKVPTSQEYMQDGNAPFRYRTLLRTLGKWSIITKRIGPLENYLLTGEERAEKFRKQEIHDLLMEIADRKAVVDSEQEALERDKAYLANREAEVKSKLDALDKEKADLEAKLNPPKVEAPGKK